MEHACHRCGGTVEDGLVSCPQCGAPQIRVGGGETVPPAAAQYFQPGQPLAPGAINWAHGLPSAAIAGVFIAVLSLLPFLSLGFCLWMLAGGGLAVALYRRRAHVEVTAGAGARLGAVSGLVGFVIFTVLAALHMLVLGGRGMRAALRHAVEEAAARNPDPRVQEMMQKFTSPEGLAALVTLTLVMFLFAFLIFATIGGAVWASIAGRGGSQSR